MEQLKEENLPFNDGQGIYTLSDAITSIRILLGRAINDGITADEIKDRDSECKSIESHKHWYKEAYQYISLLKEDLAIKEELRNQYSILYYHTCVLCDVLECQDKDEDFFVKLDWFTAVNSFDEPFKLESLRSVQNSYPFLYKTLKLDDLIRKVLNFVSLNQYFGQFLEIVSRSKKEMICLPITYHLFLPYGKFIKRYYVRNVQC